MGRNRPLLALLLGACVSLLACQVHFVGYNQEPEQGPNGNASTIKEKGPDWTDKAIVLFTLVLTAVGIWQTYLWSKANKTADDALDAAENANVAAEKAANAAIEANKIAGTAIGIARDNLVAYVNAERGLMAFGGIRVDPNVLTIDYAIKNIGRSAAYVMSIGGAILTPTTIEEHAKRRLRFVSDEANLYPLEPGGVMTTSKEIDPRAFVMNGTKNVFDEHR